MTVGTIARHFVHQSLKFVMDTCHQMGVGHQVVVSQRKNSVQYIVKVIKEGAQLSMIL